MLLKRATRQMNESVSMCVCVRSLTYKGGLAQEASMDSGDGGGDDADVRWCTASESHTRPVQLAIGFAELNTLAE